MRRKMSSEEIACHNCGEDTQDYLTKHDEDFWLCDICEKEEL
jgi:formylmethanofuran dehydrogenase subunit E